MYFFNFGICNLINLTCSKLLYILYGFFFVLLFQLFAATGSILLNIISGVIVAISSGIVPQFKNKSVEQITEEKASWIG